MTTSRARTPQKCAIDGCQRDAEDLVEVSPFADRPVGGEALAPTESAWMCADHGAAWKRNVR